MAYYDELVYIDGVWLAKETEKAYGLSRLEGCFAVDAWIPKSVIHTVDLDRDYEGSVVIPRWLAENKELEYTEYVDHDGELDW